MTDSTLFFRKARLFAAAFGTAWLGFIAAGKGMAQEQAPPPRGLVLTTCAEIHQLSAKDADRSLEARLEAVVTVVPRPPYSGLVVQDATGGLWVDLAKSRESGLWSASAQTTLQEVAVGDRLRLKGVTERGGFAPVLLPRGLEILPSRRAMPEPQEVSVAEVLTGRYDVLRVNMSGVVQETNVAGLSTADQLALKMVNPGGSILVRVPRAALPPEAELLDTNLSVSGTVISQHNSRAEMDGAVLITQRAEDVKIILRGPPADQAPLLQLTSLRPYEFRGATSSRSRVIGTVTLWHPGSRLVLQEGNAAVEVTTHSTQPILLGSVVEAAGFVSPPRPICRLENAVLRVLRQGESPQPAKITLPELLEASGRKHTNNWQRSVFDYHFRLVNLTGTLVEAFGDAGQNGRTLLLRCDGLPIPVRLDGAPAGFGKDWRPGSVLAVTGIVSIEPTTGGPTTYEPSGNGDVSLLLRDAGDVQVISAASWWTRERLVYLAWSSLALIASVLFVVLELSRRVRRQAQELAGRIALQKEAEIRFDATLSERNRLVADMHDGLQQFLAGLSMQLEVAHGSLELGRDAAPSLTTARSLLLTLREEFRHCLNALRATEAEMDIPVILERTSAIISACHPVKIRVEVLGEPVKLPGNAVANLMLITQEAATNAARHGKASTITLRCQFAPQSVTVEIEDDGIGFDPTAASITSQHYGLASMRERIARLGGTLEVHSGLGKGTRIVARLGLPLAELPQGNEASF